VRYGIAIPPCASLANVADAARRAEELGFGVAWIPDAQLLWRDVFAAMALAADRTSTIAIGSGVSGTETRHPTVVASAANTLRELAPGRIVLGLGTGAGLGQLINMPSTKRAVLRRDIEMIRTLLDGEWWDFDGRKARLIGAGGRVPIYMTAGGPRMTALAGEIAEGVIFSVGTTPEVLRASIASLTPGLEAAGRSREDIQVVSTCFFHVTDDLERDAARFKPVCVLLAKAGTGETVLRAAGIELGDLSSLPPIFPTIAHAEDWDAAVEAAATVISDEAALTFAQKFGLFGTIEEIAAKVGAIEAAGVDQLFLRSMLPYELPNEPMEAFAGAVLGSEPVRAEGR
jgi:5,10-methylenetetrahydromethanopterin reductase